MGVLLALVLAAADLSNPAFPPGAGTSTLGIDIDGNLVLPDEVYLAVVDLPADAPANAATAKLVEDQIDDFLRRAGYELAKVHAEAENGRIHVVMNEGKVEKIVYRGKLTVKTLRFQLGINLPHQVFNRPELDRQIARLNQEIGLERVWYELIPTQTVAHFGPQVENLPMIKGFELVYAQQPYELHIFFAEHDWDTGVGLDLISGYPDGLIFGVNYQGRGLLFDDDRWRAAASIGGQLRRSIVEDQLYPAPSRAFAELKYFFPQVISKQTRPFIWLRGEGISRQRPDLLIENYYHALSDASLNLHYEFVEQMSVSFGLGTQYRYLCCITTGKGTELPFELPPVQRIRSFALLHSDIVFDNGGGRWDRRHAATLEARHYFAIHDPDYGEGRVEYQRVWPIGWHDFWLKARGTWLWGEVLFHDEEPVGKHLRSVFGDTYVRRIASASAEFRFSITRDLFKLSIFDDVAVFGDLGDDPLSHLACVNNPHCVEALRFGTAFGPGFHALIEGILQFDIYLSFGFNSVGRFDSGVAAVLQKVF